MMVSCKPCTDYKESKQTVRKKKSTREKQKRKGVDRKSNIIHKSCGKERERLTQKEKRGSKASNDDDDDEDDDDVLHPSVHPSIRNTNIRKKKGSAQTMRCAAPGSSVLNTTRQRESEAIE